MRDLARIAGVDNSTVSRALRHDPRISPATQKKILRLAKRHGYVLNPLVSACMTFRKGTHTPKDVHTTLAYLIDDRYPPGKSWREGTSPLNYQGALRQAEARGYRLEQFFLQPSLTAQRTCQILQTRNIHGVLVAPLSWWGDLHLDFEWKQFSVVAIGFSLTEPPLYRVAHDFYQGMLLALHECQKRGYTRPGFAVGSGLNKRIRNFWMAAYLVAQQSFEDSNRLKPFVVAGDTFDPQAFQRWVASERPDAIISLPFPFSRTDLWQELIAGFERPIEWIHLDVHNLDGTEVGIYQDHEKIGAAAVDLLISLIERNQLGPLKNSETLLIEGSWIAGKSVKTAK